MKIVIDLPEDIYNTIKEEDVGNVVYKAIKSGTVLPSNCNLIDAIKLKETFNKELNDIDLIMNAPIIIKS